MYNFNNGIGSSNDKDPNKNRGWYRDRIKCSIQDLSDGISTKKAALIITLVIGFVVSAVLLDVGGAILAIPIALAIRSSIKHDEYMVNRKYKFEEAEKEKEIELQAQEDKRTENYYKSYAKSFNKTVLAHPDKKPELPKSVTPWDEEHYKYYALINSFVPYNNEATGEIYDISYSRIPVYAYYDGVTLREIVTNMPAKYWEDNVNNSTLYYDSLMEVTDLSRIGADIKKVGVQEYKNYICNVTSFNTVISRYSAEVLKDKSSDAAYVRDLVSKHNN